MIVGIGTDIVEIDRIREAIKSKAFLKKCYTENEIELFCGDKLNVNSLAANFAGKEAVSKIFGTGVRGFDVRDIEVLRDELGKPFVNLYNGALQLKTSKNIDFIHITLSHSKDMAIAYAVGESYNN